MDYTAALEELADGFSKVQLKWEGEEWVLTVSEEDHGDRSWRSPEVCAVISAAYFELT